MSLIEEERHRYLRWMWLDVTTAPPWRNHEQRVAALIVAYDLLHATPPYKPTYSATVGKCTLTVYFTREALADQAELQALIDKMNAEAM